MRNRPELGADFENMLAQRFVRRAVFRTRGAVFRQRGAVFQPGRLHLLHEMGSVRRMSLGIWAESRPARAVRGGSSSVVHDTRGVVIIEYVVVLLLVSALACSAIVVLGMAVARFFFSQEAWLSIPIP